MASTGSSIMDIIDTTTILSLLSTLTILVAAYTLSLYSLSPSSTLKTRVLFVWHAFDALIHFILEGSYLYNCFFAFTQVTTAATAVNKSSQMVSAFLPPNVHFLGSTHSTRLYGANHGTSPFSALWREYAKADARWGGTDLTVVSLELLTVFVMGPVAVWICTCLARSSNATGRSPRSGSEWFWMIVLATGELYGGFMTFCPEWLSGSPSLDTSNFMYLWVYLFFFNTLWVWIPLWILYEAYFAITGAPQAQQGGQTTKKQL